MPVTIKGTGGGSVTLDAGAAAADTTLTLPNTTGTILQSGTAVTVAQGGTGLTSPGTAGNVLTSTGSAWASSAPAATFGTGPAFSAYQTGTAQVLTANVWTKITLNAEEFDTNSNFDSTTNYRFTPTVAGYYQVNGIICTPSNTTITVGIYKNGALFKTGTGTTTYGINVAMAALIYCNGSTDYLEMFGFSTVTATMSTGASGCVLQAFQARSA